MAKDPAKTGPKGNATQPKKRVARGFLKAGALASGAMRQAGGKRGFAEYRLLTEWREIVGNQISQFCRPLKVSYAGRSPGLGATLVLGVDGARGPEVEMQKARIIERVNAFYGYRAVSRISLNQARGAADPGFAEDQAGFEPRTPPQAAPTSGVDDPDLALALGRLGANITTKAARARRSATRR